MIWTPWSDLRVRAAALCSTVAVVATVGAGIAALRSERVPPAPPVDIVPGAAQAVYRRAAGISIAALDPFGLAYTAPPASETTPLAAPPSILLVGTIIGGDQPAAACRLGDAPARILHVGDTLGGWRLERVAPGRVVFIDAGGMRHELRLSPLGN